MSTREQKLLESVEKLLDADGKQIYSTMSETKSAFVSFNRILKILLKNTSQLHEMLWVQIRSQIVSIYQNTESREKLLDRLDNQEYQIFGHSVHCEQQATANI